MIEHTHLDSPDVSIQPGEIRKTWHTDRVLCILEAIWGGQVRSRVIESHSTNIKVVDILNWTETRWKSFESTSAGEGTYEILAKIGAPKEAHFAGEVVGREEWQIQNPILDTTPDQAPRIPTKSEVVLIPTEPEVAIMEGFLVPQDVQKQGWIDQHFVSKKGMIRLSQMGGAKLAGFSTQARKGLIEQLQITFEKEGFIFLTAES